MNNNKDENQKNIKILENKVTSLENKISKLEKITSNIEKKYDKSNFCFINITNKEVKIPYLKRMNAFNLSE
jgi:seryl-tRNA synthetase